MGEAFNLIKLDVAHILTADLDDASFNWLDGLRRAHFPPERNFLSAHLTLFHRLSPAQIVDLRSFEVPRNPIAVCFNDVIFLGFGVALHVASDELLQLREAIRMAVGGEFSRQDSQRWKPHVTIQNKVTSESARQLHESLERRFSQRAGTVTGLRVWKYLGGPWRLVDRIAFEDPR